MNVSQAIELAHSERVVSITQHDDVPDDLCEALVVLAEEVLRLASGDDAVLLSQQEAATYPHVPAYATQKFESDAHALLTGQVLMLLTLNDISTLPLVTDEGDYTPDVMLSLPSPHPDAVPLQVVVRVLPE